MVIDTPGQHQQRAGVRGAVQRVTGLWPVVRQLTGADRTGHGAAVRSTTTDRLVNRNATADRVVDSICPYCAVGCGQKVYVTDEKVVQVEGDPASPISRGRLCPKGSASTQLVTSPSRVTTVRYRRPAARSGRTSSWARRWR